MPEYPFVYGTGEPRLVEGGGTRFRLARRRPRQERGGDGQGDRGGDQDRDEAWRALLSEAVDELNASFAAAGTDFRCSLEEDPQGFALHVRRRGDGGETREVDEELLEFSDLPAWLRRLRSRLGLLVDERA